MGIWHGMDSLTLLPFCATLVRLNFSHELFESMLPMSEKEEDVLLFLGSVIVYLLFVAPMFSWLDTSSNITRGSSNMGWASSFTNVGEIALVECGVGSKLISSAPSASREVRLPELTHNLVIKADFDWRYSLQMLRKSFENAGYIRKLMLELKANRVWEMVPINKVQNLTTWHPLVNDFCIRSSVKNSFIAKKEIYHVLLLVTCNDLFYEIIYNVIQNDDNIT